MNKKIAWLNSVGAIESDRKEFRWYVPAADMYYSEEYIESTPLDEIKRGYDQHARSMQQPVNDSRMDDGEFLPIIIAASFFTAALTNLFFMWLQ